MHDFIRFPTIDEKNSRVKKEASEFKPVELNRVSWSDRRGRFGEMHTLLEKDFMEAREILLSTDGPLVLDGVSVAEFYTYQTTTS